jgi:hypothetical protein
MARTKHGNYLEEQSFYGYIKPLSTPFLEMYRALRRRAGRCKDVLALQSRRSQLSLSGACPATRPTSPLSKP